MGQIQRFEAKGLIPKPPGDLNDYGMAEWSRVCSILVENTNLEEMDMSMLYAYCNEWGKYIFFEKELENMGRVARAPSGYPIVHPYESMAKKALAMALDIGKQFGMTPASRGKLKKSNKKSQPAKFSLD